MTLHYNVFQFYFKIIHLNMSKKSVQANMFILMKMFSKKKDEMLITKYNNKNKGFTKNNYKNKLFLFT